MENNNNAYYHLLIIEKRERERERYLQVERMNEIKRNKSNKK